MPPGYFITCKNRPTRGGGICLVYKDVYTIKTVDSDCTEFLEYMVLHIRKNTINLIMIILYRVPGTNFQIFLETFTEVLSAHGTNYEQILIMGDFNVPINKNCSSSKKLFSIFDEFGLTNFSNSATQRSGNTLDLVVSNIELSNLNILDISISDHYFLDFCLPISLPSPSKKVTKNVKIWKDVNWDDLNTSLMISLNQPLLFESSHTNEIFDNYLGNFRDLINAHVHEKVILEREKRVPYFDGECTVLKRRKRHFERVYRKSKRHEDLRIYQNSVEVYRKHLSKLRDQYYSKIFNETDVKAKFNALKNILNNKRNQRPESDDNISLANDILDRKSVV